jgi:hypothetical protein
MPTILKTKNSVTTTVVPTTLQQGELAVNITDKKLWVGNAATTPVQLLGTGADGTFTNISVSDVASFADGTVSLPSITNIGDTNTGIYFPAADTIAFTEGGAESMRIDSSGNLLIGKTSATANGGNLQVSSGITFPATQVAKTDANTLDDYEEGTWTPVVTAAVGSITTYTSAGQYIKIGSLVVAQFQYGITVNGTGATAIYLAGLPFAGTANTSGGLAREIAVVGVSGGAYLPTTTSLLIATAAGAYMGGTGWQVVGTISYQAT